MDSFKMACPKCGSYSYSIERDPRNYAQRGQVSELIFSCRCGKQFFGEQIQEEHDRQKAFWDAQMAAPTAAEIERRAAEKERVDRQEQLRAAYEFQAKYMVEKRKAEAEAARVREEVRLREWRERVARQQAAAAAMSASTVVAAAAVDTEAAPEGVAEGRCEWEGCTNSVRPGSKYCSRECSNKNARWRHKQRVKPNGA
jgi:membrane protein involved in colicin uptake